MTEIDLTDTRAGISSPNESYAVLPDRAKLKIASFRTREGAWADFTAAANKRGLTATDVLKKAMEQFTNGEYNPTVNTGIHTLVSTQPNITREEVQELIDTAVSTTINTDTLQDSIMTAVSALSLPTDESINTSISTAVSMALAPLQDEIANIKKAISDRVDSPDAIANPQSEAKILADEPQPVTTSKRKQEDIITPRYEQLKADPTLLSLLRDAIDRFDDDRKAIGNHLLSNGYGKKDKKSGELKPYDSNYVGRFKQALARIDIDG